MIDYMTPFNRGAAEGRVARVLFEHEMGVADRADSSELLSAVRVAVLEEHADAQRVAELLDEWSVALAGAPETVAAAHAVLEALGRAGSGSRPGPPS